MDDPNLVSPTTAHLSCAICDDILTKQKWWHFNVDLDKLEKSASKNTCALCSLLFDGMSKVYQSQQRDLKSSHRMTTTSSLTTTTGSFPDGARLRVISNDDPIPIVFQLSWFADRLSTLALDIELFRSPGKFDDYGFNN